MWLFVCGAFAGPRPADPIEARLAYPLRAPAAGEVDTFRDRFPEPLDPVLATVVVEGEAGIGARLARAGFAVEAEGPGLAQVRVPWTRLRALAAEEGVRRVREPWRAHPKETVTEGYDATMATDWHDLGVSGKGAFVGIVDVGFRGYADLLGTELPGSVDTDFSRGDENATDHGAAVAEILADFAPKAHLLLASFSTDVEFCAIMEEMVGEGVDVVNGSIGFDNVWHADGTSSLSVCADWAVENGALYFAAAGNENDKYRVGPLAYTGNDGAVTIRGEAEIPVYSQRGYVDVSFRWSEPFGSAAQDLDLIVFNDDGTECGRSEQYQLGQEGDIPYEYVNASGCSDVVYASVYSVDSGAHLDGLEGYLYGYYGMDEAFWTNTEDLTLPGDLRTGVSVGAYYAEDDQVADYSSRGPTNDDRIKPDVVAPTGVTTVTYGRGQFEGSSAATPHAAGLGALWVSATRSHGTPEAMRDWMIGAARDLGDAGVDNVSGAGAIVGDELPEAPPKLACGCASGPAPGWAALAMVGLLLARRRA